MHIWPIYEHSYYSTITVLNYKTSKRGRRNSKVLDKVNHFLQYTSLASNRVYNQLKITFNYKPENLLHRYSNCLMYKPALSYQNWIVRNSLPFCHNDINMVVFYHIRIEVDFVVCLLDASAFFLPNLPKAVSISNLSQASS